MTVAAGSELLSFATWAHRVSEKGVASSLSETLVCNTPGIAGGRLSVEKLDNDLDVSEGGGESEAVELDGVRSSSSVYFMLAGESVNGHGMHL